MAEFFVSMAAQANYFAAQMVGSVQRWAELVWQKPWILCKRARHVPCEGCSS
jgi:hypothetical protein